jgi:peptidoglycan glycosyltransferase
LVDEIRDQSGQIISRPESGPWLEAMEPATAALVAEGMRGVVAEGTARRLDIDGLVMGAKTGTAQVAAGQIATHAWLVGFAGLPNQAPAVAFAVFVAADQEAGEQTGGRVAAPIAREVLLELFNISE